MSFFPTLLQSDSRSSQACRWRPMLVTDASRCTQACRWHSQICRSSSQVIRNLSQSLPWYSSTSHHWSQLLRGPARMPSYGLTLFWIWCILVYTPHPLRHWWSLQVIKFHFADEASSGSSHWWPVSIRPSCICRVILLFLVCLSFSFLILALAAQEVCS
jgi:hypothetical protein